MAKQVEMGREWYRRPLTPLICQKAMKMGASSLLGRDEVKSFDFDYNSHCTLAEREEYAEWQPSLADAF